MNVFFSNYCCRYVDVISILMFEVSIWVIYLELFIVYMSIFFVMHDIICSIIKLRVVVRIISYSFLTLWRLKSFKAF